MCFSVVLGFCFVFFLIISPEYCHCTRICRISIDYVAHYYVINQEEAGAHSTLVSLSARLVALIHKGGGYFTSADYESYLIGVVHVK